MRCPRARETEVCSLRCSEEDELEVEGAFRFLSRGWPVALEAVLWGTGVPQRLQNLAPKANTSLHVTQVLTGVPHCPQNLASGCRGELQLLHGEVLGCDAEELDAAHFSAAICLSPSGVKWYDQAAAVCKCCWPWLYYTLLFKTETMSFLFEPRSFPAHRRFPYSPS